MATASRTSNEVPHRSHRLRAVPKRNGLGLVGSEWPDVVSVTCNSFRACSGNCAAWTVANIRGGSEAFRAYSFRRPSVIQYTALLNKMAQQKPIRLAGHCPS